jgi:hypothetical protein
MWILVIELVGSSEKVLDSVWFLFFALGLRSFTMVFILFLGCFFPVIWCVFCFFSEGGVRVVLSSFGSLHPRLYWNAGFVRS